MSVARICTYCGFAAPIEQTNDWFVATKVARMDNPVPRVDETNKPIEGAFHLPACLVGWAQDQKKADDADRKKRGLPEQASVKAKT